MFLMSWHILSARLFIIFLLSNIINIYLLKKKKLKLKKSVFEVSWKKVWGIC